MPNPRGRGRWSQLSVAPPLPGAPLAGRPFPGPAPAGTPESRSAPLTLATRIIRLATSRSPWWFWPISAMIKHGCCPPTQRPGHSSSSSGIAAARAPAPLGPPGSGRHCLRSVESAAQRAHTSTPPRQPAAAARPIIGPRLAPRRRGRSYPLGRQCCRRRKSGVLRPAWARGFRLASVSLNVGGPYVYR